MAVVTVGAHPSTAPRAAAWEPEGPARFAAFDLDRTLLPGSSLGLFARALAAERVITRWDVARHAVHQGVFTGWGLSARTLERLCAELATAAAHDALGTVGEVADGRYTGRLLGDFCHGEGKLRRLRSLLGPVQLRRTAAYGDATSDLPVLRAVARPVAVNPDRGLTAAALAARWPILRLG